MTDRIAEAARATRRYHMDCSLHTGVQTCFVVESASGNITLGPILYSSTEAQAACDRLNLLAVLEAIRKPSEGMLRASDRFAHTDETENIDWKGIARIQWRAMIDALIAEVSNDQR